MIDFFVCLFCVVQVPFRIVLLLCFVWLVWLLCWYVVSCCFVLVCLALDCLSVLVSLVWFIWFVLFGLSCFVLLCFVLFCSVSVWASFSLSLLSVCSCLCSHGCGCFCYSSFWVSRTHVVNSDDEHGGNHLRQQMKPTHTTVDIKLAEIAGHLQDSILRCQLWP